MNCFKQLTLITTLIFCSFALAAQTVSLGPKLGFINSGYNGNDGNQIDRRNGVSVGAFFNISPGLGYFAIQPELLYTQKGGKRSLPGNFQEELKIGYLEMPILFKVAIPINETLFPNAFVGPYTSLKLNESHTVTQLDTGFEVESNKDYRTADFGGVFGLGLDIKSESIFFTTDLRYHLGATQVQKGDDAEDFKNGSFSINVGVGFRLYGSNY